MKKIILFFTIASLFAACRNQARTDAASTDSIVSPAPVAEKPVVVQKEVHYVNTSSNAAEPERKKGWSNAAKGAVIGGGTGAVVGAVADKKHAQGAVIGAAVGAGAGFLIGKHKDKKHRRRHS
jgi:NAD kinase